MIPLRAKKVRESLGERDRIVQFSGEPQREVLERKPLTV
jgi:hypothetical protein